MKFLRHWMLLVVLSLSHVWLCNPMDTKFPCPSPSLGVCSNSCPLSWWCYPTIYLILCHAFLLLPSVFPSISIFSNESVLHIRWPKYWSFMLNINPSSEYSGLISFRMTGCISLQSKGLKSLLQHHSSKPSILWRSALFIVQLLGENEFHVFEQQWKILLVVCGDWFFSWKFRELIYVLKSSSITIFSSHRCYWYKYCCICLSAYIYI